MGLIHSIEIVFCTREPVGELVPVIEQAGWRPARARFRYQMMEPPDLKEVPFWSRQPVRQEADAADWPRVRQELIANAERGNISEVELQPAGRDDDYVEFGFWPPETRQGKGMAS